VRIAAVSTAIKKVKQFILHSEIAQYRDVFAILDKLIFCESVEHEIETTVNLFYKLLYNLSERKLAALCKYIAITLEKGWIQHFTSSAGALILFILKKDSSLCLCVDYYVLNKITIKN
jgi:hypothetical protein